VRNANWRPKPGQGDIPAILSAIVRDTALEQPLNTELVDIESAQLIGSSPEGDAAASTPDVSGEEVPEDSPADLRPIGNIKHPDSMMFYDLIFARDNSNHISTNMAERDSKPLVDSVRHVMGPQHCRPSFKSHPWNLLASHRRLLFDSAPRYYCTSRTKLPRSRKAGMRNRCFIQHPEGLGVSLPVVCGDVYTLASSR
jgi:hypothetical protein